MNMGQTLCYKATEINIKDAAVTYTYKAWDNLRIGVTTPISRLITSSTMNLIECPFTWRTSNKWTIIRSVNNSSTDYSNFYKSLREG